MSLANFNAIDDSEGSLVRAGVMEDDIELRRLFCLALEKEKVVAQVYESAADAISAACEGRIDFLLLDIGLGTENGVEIIKDLRHVSQVPVVIISGQTDANIVCAALDAGGDDFLRKPVTIPEFRAHIRSVTRRLKPLFQSLPEDTFTVDGVAFDLSRGLARSPSNATCTFTDREIVILQCLFKQPGQPVSRDSFARAIFGQCWDPNARILDVHIANIRSKLQDIGASGRLIRTRRNIGYAIFPDKPKKASPA